MADKKRLAEIRAQLAVKLGPHALGLAGDWRVFWVSVDHRRYEVPEGTWRYIWAEREKPRLNRPKIRQRRRPRRR